MSDAGGQITHLGVLYQDKITALYLGRLIDPRAANLPQALQVTQVRGENPSTEVDDITVRFADGHVEYMQAKSALEKGGKAWEKLWSHFDQQRRSPDFGALDRLVILMGDYASWYKPLKELCQKASSSLDAREWRERLSKEQTELAEKIRGQFSEKAGGMTWDALQGLLRQVELRFIENEAIESDQLPYWMPESSRALDGLFDQLLALVLKAASEGRSFERESLEQTLTAKGVQIKPLNEQPPAKRALPDPDELPEPVLRDELPQGYSLPLLRNPLFIGRVDDLKALALHLLHAPKKDAVLAQGIGGVGKTQLAVEFCYRYGRYFQGLHWLQVQPKSADADQDIRLAIVECGKVMALRPWPDDFAGQLQRTLDEWARRKPSLVIIDNLEDAKVLANWLPKLRGCRVLVTCRKGKWSKTANLEVYPLGLLSPEESRSLLRSLCGRLVEEPDSSLTALAEQLGRLPLALDLAGRYLADRSRLSVADYLETLKSKGVLEDPAFKDWTDENPTEHNTSLAQTFSLSWAELVPERESDLVARRVFMTCGFCAPNIEIPYEILESACLQEGQDEALLDKALRRLYELGMLAEGESGPVIHPLLAEFARLEESKTEEDLQSNLAELFDWFAEELHKVGYRKEFSVLRGHMAAAVSFLDSKEQLARLLNNLGYYTQEMGDLAGALPYYQQALALDKEIYGERHVETATTLNNIGLLMQFMGELDEAEKYSKEALEIYQEALGPSHTNIARSLNNLGGLMQVKGDMDGAISCFEQAMAMYTAEVGEKHLETARAMNNYGLTLQTIGDYKGAGEYYQKALAVYQELHEGLHPDLAMCYNNLGYLNQMIGELGEAKQYYEKAWEIYLETLGENHPDVIKCAGNMGGVLQAMGEFGEAEEYLTQALEKGLVVLGNAHPDVGLYLNNLGELQRSQGRLAEAIANFEKAYAIFKESLGEKHVYTMMVLNNTGLAYQGLGLFDKARPYHEHCAALAVDVLGNNHVHTATFLNSLGELERNQGRFAESAEHCKAAYTIFMNTVGEKYVNTIMCLNSIGLALQGLGKFDEAQPYHERCAALAREVMGENHIHTATFINNLGVVYKELKATAEAEQQFQLALEIYLRVVGENHLDTARCYTNLANLAYEQGNLPQALDYSERCLAARQVLLGELNIETAASHWWVGLILSNLNRMAEAKAQIEAALRTLEAIMPPGDPNVNTVRDALSYVNQALAQEGGAG